jgi:hypothetical protein
MKRRDSTRARTWVTTPTGYYAHYYYYYVVDGGKARIVLNALVSPFEVTENAPMVELLSGGASSVGG